ncbi:hypothetical protein C8R46DRAFT_1218763 [Mycena filopes]|nr:hypothetical protein C8R46DRAFT_1218763 [Mycena filopes]
MSETQTPQAGRIESLPPETLIEILRHGAEILPSNSPDMVPFPTIASQVCRLWRNLALATPDMWTTIRISEELESIAAAGLYIARTRNRLLDITITLPPHSNYSIDYVALRHFDRVLNILGPHCRRWRTLALCVGHIDMHQLSFFLQSKHPEEFAQLTYLHLAEGIMAKFRVPRLPRLQAVRVQDIDTIVPVVGERMEALHTLDIISASEIVDYRFGESSFQRAVERMPHLTTPVLREFQHAPREAFELRTIRSLAVQFVSFGPGSLELLTAWFKAPNLEYLELQNIFFESRYEDHARVEVPLTWGKPQFPSLRTLRLVDATLTPRRLALLESLCPDITALELVNVNGTDTLPTIYIPTFSRQPSSGYIHYTLVPAKPSSATNREDNPPWPALRTLRVDSASFGPWVRRFVARRHWLGRGRGLTSLGLSPGPKRARLPVHLAKILEPTPFSTCGLLQGFTRPFFEDGSDFQAIRAPVKCSAYEDEDSEPDSLYDL